MNRPRRDGLRKSSCRSWSWMRSRTASPVDGPIPSAFRSCHYVVFEVRHHRTCFLKIMLGHSVSGGLNRRQPPVASAGRGRSTRGDPDLSPIPAGRTRDHPVRDRTGVAVRRTGTQARPVGSAQVSVPAPGRRIRQLSDPLDLTDVTLAGNGPGTVSYSPRSVTTAWTGAACRVWCSPTVTAFAHFPPQEFKLLVAMCKASPLLGSIALKAFSSGPGLRLFAKQVAHQCIRRENAGAIFDGLATSVPVAWVIGTSCSPWRTPGGWPVSSRQSSCVRSPALRPM